MKRLRTLLVRATIGVLLLVALAGSVVYADTTGPVGSGAGFTVPSAVPEDPGIE
jgi:hypothetical protein